MDKAIIKDRIASMDHAKGLIVKDIKGRLYYYNGEGLYKLVALKGTGPGRKKKAGDN